MIFTLWAVAGLTSEQNPSQVSEAKEALHEDSEEIRAASMTEYGKGLIVAVTYGTALGGMGTLIGSGPNVMLPGFYRQRFPNETGLNFLSWCYFALPLLIPYVTVTWLYLAWYFCPPSAVAVVGARMNRSMVEKDYAALGNPNDPELVQGKVFCAADLGRYADSPQRDRK